MPFARHAVEDIRQGHGADRSRQAMPGEIAEQQVHVATGVKGGQQQVAIEQRIGRLQVAHIARPQATGVGHLVENRLGDQLLVLQVLVVSGDLVALAQHLLVQASQAVHGIDLGFENHPAVGFGEKVIAARLQATDQRFIFAHRGQEDDRHHGFTGHGLDPPGRFETVHHRHQRIHQYQLRALRLEQRQRLQPIGGHQYPMPLATHDGRQQHAISGAVLGNQDGEG